MEQLARAAAAIEAGNMSEAHVLLAQAIKANPNDVDAWLLLSQTAGSVEQKKTFLKRALIVDPDNATARQRLAELDQPELESDSFLEEAPDLEKTALGHEDNLADTVVETMPETAIVAEQPTPPSFGPAKDIQVDAPEELLAASPFVAEDDAPPEVMLPDESYTDPFDFDSQEEEVPDWLKGEVSAAASTEDVPAEPAVEAAGEVATMTEEGAETDATQVQEAAAPATPQPVAAPRAVAGVETSKSTRSGTEWLEWVIVALALLLFLTVIYLIAA